ncbi:MAG: hypothetical protein ACE5E6_03550, partial [Phycisphaerae bacterium]
MILVTVGTERFDALVCEVDRLAARGLIHDRVYAQIGMSRPAPTHLDYVRYDRALLDKAAGADLIIT